MTAQKGDGSNDCSGHGTRVAAVVGGATYGVAEETSLVSVRVVGYTFREASRIIAGADWVMEQHACSDGPMCGESAVTSGLQAVDDAVRAIIAAGVSTAVAAVHRGLGGMALDACTISPARVAEAMTVSSTDDQGRRTSFAPLREMRGLVRTRCRHSHDRRDG